ncbi:MAG: hypothetical protein VKL39_09825 [Leptolyngbyaceae bacterium]|nr:hypothetical protein [Leptolyngbyaceae bacterium]
MFGWGASSSRLDRIEANLEQLVEISVATNRRIDRFVETTQAQIESQREELETYKQRTEQMQRAIEYLLSKDS